MEKDRDRRDCMLPLHGFFAHESWKPECLISVDFTFVVVVKHAVDHNHNDQQHIKHVEGTGYQLAQGLEICAKCLRRQVKKTSRNVLNALSHHYDGIERH